MISLFDQALPKSFWELVMPEPNSGCWLWLGSLNDKGYGPHRSTTGPAPEGCERDHKCRVRSCCNPGHIEFVSHKENVRRIPRVRPTECKHGHAFTEENSYVTPDGRLQCRTCLRRRDKESYDRKRGR